MSKSYLINEMYPCLQGEGVNIGKPSLLVRFQICNLRCSWCDTPYTHTFKSDPVKDETSALSQKFKRIPLVSLVEQIKQHESLDHLILTGGEPTLQNLIHIMNELPQHTAEVESNGTRIPHKHFSNFRVADYARFQWNISPKGNNAGENVSPEALEHWSVLAQSHEKVYFKFVVRKAEAVADFAEIMNTVQTHKICRDRVYLMPEGTTVESQLGNEWLHDLCLSSGFRYTPRLHILLFGHKRGV